MLNMTWSSKLEKSNEKFQEQWKNIMPVFAQDTVFFTTYFQQILIKFH